MVLLIIILLCTGLSASQTNLLSLNDCLELAFKNNYTIQEEKINLHNANLDLAINKNAYYPKLDLSANLPEYTRYFDYYKKRINQNSYLEDHYFYNGINNNLTAHIYSEIPTGAEVDVRLRGVHNIVNSENEIYKEDDYDIDYVFSAEITQPLFRRNITAIEITKKSKQLKNFNINYDQTIKNIRHSVTVSYYNLLRSVNNYEIKEDLYNKSKLNYDLGVKKFQTGLVPEVDVWQLEISYNKNQASLLEAGNRIRKDKENLLFSMGMSLDYMFKIGIKINYYPYLIDYNKTLNNTLENDSYVNNLEYNNYLKDEEYKRIKDDSNLNVFASMYYNYYYNQNEKFTPSQSFYEYDFGASLALTYPLVDFGLSSQKLTKVRKQLEINQIKLKKYQIQLKKELNQLLRNIEENRKKISIYSNAVNIAQKRYNINSEQFQDGIITTLDLLTSESDLNSSRISYLDAVINYNIRLSEIYRDYHVIEKR